MSLVRGSGKGGGGASIAEDMYFASTAERDQFTTDNPSRIFQGVTCAVGNASAYDYYQYDMANTQWRDANLIFQGQKGEKGDSGDVSQLKVDYPLSINTEQGVTTISADDAITFKGGKIGEQDAHLDVDIQRDCSIRFVTDDPAVGYNVVDAYADSEAPDGYYAKFGSRSLTSYLTSKENIRTSINGVDGVVYTSQNPQPATLPVLIQDDVTYTTVEDLIKNPRKILQSNKIGGITITLDIPRSELDKYDDKSICFTIVNTISNVGDCFYYDKTKDIRGIIPPNSIETVFYFKREDGYYGVQESGVFVVYPSGLLDFGLEQWTVPDGNKVIVLEDGEVQNLHPDVNGKICKANVEITAIESEIYPGYNRCVHLVTIISESSDVNGTQYIRSADKKEDIISAPFVKVGQESGLQPSKGFTLDKDSNIKATLQDGSTITDMIGLASNADNLILGSDKLDTVIEAKTGAYVDLNGSIKKVLLEGEGGQGFPDNKDIDMLTESYQNLSVGKWYVDGWDNSSGLPDWKIEDRIAALTVFGGYDGTANGAFWLLGSHRKGIYAAVKSSGVSSQWYKLDDSSSNTPLTVDVAHDWNESQEITAEDIANALGKIQGDDVSTHTDNLGPKSLSSTTFKVQRPADERANTSPFAYSFFAFPLGFFTDDDGNPSEPTMVNTGSGNSSDWITSIVELEGQKYQVMVSPNRNSAPLLPSAKLVQPGVLKR